MAGPAALARRSVHENRPRPPRRMAMAGTPAKRVLRAKPPPPSLTPAELTKTEVPSAPPIVGQTKNDGGGEGAAPTEPPPPPGPQPSASPAASFGDEWERGGGGA